MHTPPNRAHTRPTSPVRYHPHGSSAALSPRRRDNKVFTSGSGKHTRVFTVEKSDEYRCVCYLPNGRPCNRLLGKGAALEYETVCPKCGATLMLTKSGIRVKQTAKRK